MRRFDCISHSDVCFPLELALLTKLKMVKGSTEFTQWHIHMIYTINISSKVMTITLQLKPVELQAYK